jgi:hypothetical protein
MGQRTRDVTGHRGVHERRRRHAIDERREVS